MFLLLALALGLVKLAARPTQPSAVRPRTHTKLVDKAGKQVNTSTPSAKTEEHKAGRAGAQLPPYLAVVHSIDGANVHARMTEVRPFRKQYVGLLLAGPSFGKYSGCVLIAADILDAYRVTDNESQPLCLAFGDRTPRMIRTIKRVPGLLIVKPDPQYKPVSPLCTAAPEVGTPVSLTDGTSTTQGLIVATNVYARVSRMSYARIFVIKSAQLPTPGSVVRDRSGAVIGICVEVRSPHTIQTLDQVHCAAIAIDDAIAYAENPHGTVSTHLEFERSKDSGAVAEIQYPPVSSQACHGDLVLEVNGTSPQDFEHMHHLIQNSALPHLTLTLLRNYNTPAAHTLTILVGLVPWCADVIRCGGLRLAATQVYWHDRWQHSYAILDLSVPSEFADIFNCPHPTDPAIQVGDTIISIGGYKISDPASGRARLEESLRRLRSGENLRIDLLRTTLGADGQLVATHKTIALRYDAQSKMFRVYDPVETTGTSVP